VTFGDATRQEGADPVVEARGRALPLVLWAAATCVASIAYLGWATHSGGMIRLRLGLAPMQPNTAVAMLCLCGGTFSLRLGWTVLRWFLGCTALLLGAASLTAYLTGFESGIDLLFVPSTVLPEDLFPGRMSPPTAAATLLLAISLLGMCGSGPRRRAALASLPMVLSLGCSSYFLFEYALLDPPAYGWATTTRMGFNTALCLSLLAVGALAEALAQDEELTAAPWLSSAAAMFAQVFVISAIWGTLDLTEIEALRERVAHYGAEHKQALLLDEDARLAALEALARRAPTSERRGEHALWRGRALQIVEQADYDWIAWLPASERGELVCHSLPCPKETPSLDELRADLASLPVQMGAGKLGVSPMRSLSRWGRFGEERIVVLENVAPDGAPRILMAVRRVSVDSSVAGGCNSRSFLCTLGHGPGSHSGQGTGRVDSPYAVTLELPLLGDTGYLSVTPAEALVRSSYSKTPTLVLCVGLLLSFLCGTTLYYHLRSRELRCLRESDLNRLELVLNQLTEGVAFATKQGRLEFLNDRGSEILGVGMTDAGPSEWPTVYGLLSDDGKQPLPHDDMPLVRALRGERVDDVEVAFWDTKKSRVGHLLASARPVLDANGQLTGGVVVFRDISSIREAREAQEDMEIQLRQAQKMEAIGQLAAGIAHEMNTPAQYVSDNLGFIKEAFEEIMTILSELDGLRSRASKEPITPELMQPLIDVVEKADLDFLLEEIPSAIQQSHEGISRVTKIVRAMRDFAHPGSPDKQLIDLAKAIRSTVTVTRNEWKYVAEVETDLTEDLHEVLVVPGEFNQVILNLIVNAAHAIGEVSQEGGTRGRIRIETRRDGPWALISVSDTGPGIPEEIQARVFEPFFTTKAVGKGTGQGLAIVHAIIVEKHQGRIDIKSEPGEGTTFEIRIPLSDASGSA